MSERMNRVDFVVQKYRLDENTVIQDETMTGTKLGVGKVMASETLQFFIDADPSGNCKYLDWMIFQAGGGQEMMEKSLQLWHGNNESDPNSLRSQCHSDFLAEQVNGYEDEGGTYHSAVSTEEAELAWKATEERCKFQFVMGDQDVAIEEGFGFFRFWPGKNGIYPKIVNAVKLWHMAQPKLVAQNQRFERYRRLNAVLGEGREKRNVVWSKDDWAFMERRKEQPPAAAVLDIYSGWKPKEYSQAGAVYKSLNDLLRALADVRKLQILRDVRFEKVYEDAYVLAVCPLTIGASIKFGIGKWCVCNRTEFDRSFDNRVGGTEGNWQRYNKTGPLVFLSWKVPMPAWLHKIAIHINREKLAKLTGNWNDVNWIDCRNNSSSTSYAEIIERIERGATNPWEPQQPKGTVINDEAINGVSSDERFYKWGGRSAGRAWTDSAEGELVLHSLAVCLSYTRTWAANFDPERVVLDYVTDLGSAVDRTDE